MARNKTSNRVPLGLNSKTHKTIPESWMKSEKERQAAVKEVEQKRQQEILAADREIILDDIKNHWIEFVVCEIPSLYQAYHAFLYVVGNTTAASFYKTKALRMIASKYPEILERISDGKILEIFSPLKKQLLAVPRSNVLKEMDWVKEFVSREDNRQMISKDFFIYALKYGYLEWCDELTAEWPDGLDVKVVDDFLNKQLKPGLGVENYRLWYKIAEKFDLLDTRVIACEKYYSIAWIIGGHYHLGESFADLRGEQQDILTEDAEVAILFCLNSGMITTAGNISHNMSIFLGPKFKKSVAEIVAKHQQYKIEPRFGGPRLKSH